MKGLGNRDDNSLDQKKRPKVWGRKLAAIAIAIARGFEEWEKANGFLFLGRTRLEQ